MHESVNERLRHEIDFLRAQNMQFRMMLGVLVRRLGVKQSMSSADFDEMRKAELAFITTAHPAKPATETEPAVPEILDLEVLTAEELKQRQADAPRIEPAKPQLVIAAR